MISTSYHHGHKGPALVGSTIGRWFADVCEQYGDRDALISLPQGIRWSYHDLWRRTEELSLALLALGVKQGEHVGIWSTNNAEWVLVQLATARIGAVLVNVNPAWKRDELADGLARSRVSTLFLIPEFRSSEYETDLVALCPELAGAGETCGAPTLPDLRRAIVYDPADAGRTAPRPGDFLSWPDVLEQASAVDERQLLERERELGFDDAINIQFTSGTTGHPKSVVLTHHGLLNNALLAGDLLGVGPEDRVCVPVPFYHCFGMVLANLLALARGAALVIPSEHFDATATLRTIQDERCTVLHGVPTMFIEQLDSPGFEDYDLSSLRTGIMAGAPCPPELVRRVIDEMTCADIRIGYGMTEVSPLTHLTREGDSFDRRTRTVGTTLPHLEVKVVDVDTGRLGPRGEPGEICFRGYQVMREYLDDPEATDEAVDRDGWLRSGDLGFMEADGVLSITGRLKNMIVRGGENLYPAEIESFLFEHPAIADVAVFGLPDDRLGEDVAAWVRLHPGESLTVDDLKGWARERIAHHKVPRWIWFVDEFPETVTGKIKKFAVREIAARWLREGRAEHATAETTAEEDA
jgi:fatty-acyl-CoA synthase